MTFCKKCGTQIKEGAKFCGSCGTAVTPPAVVEQAPVVGRKTSDEDAGLAGIVGEAGEESPANDDGGVGAVDSRVEKSAAAAQVESAAAATAATEPTVNKVADLKTKASSILSTSIGKKIAAGVAAGAVALVAIIVFVVVSTSGVPLDTVKQGVQENIAQNGVASNTFVEKSDYAITDLKIEKQEEKTLSTLEQALVGSSKGTKVTFSGTIKNDYFQTDFTGTAEYVKSGDTWTTLSSPSLSDSTTKPLKGVSAINNSSSSGYDLSNFSSTLEDNSGTYKSVATADKTYSFWFATDTCKTTRTFTFDGKEWKADGEAEDSDANTAWSLTGKKFSHNNESIFLGRSWDSVLTIVDASDPNAVQASYTLKWEAGSSSSWQAGDYSGNLTGALKHAFGKDDFDFTLNDTANSVTFKGSDNGTTTIAGKGTVNRLSVSIASKYVTSKSSYSTSTFSTSYSEFDEE